MTPSTFFILVSCSRYHDDPKQIQTLFMVDFEKQRMTHANGFHGAFNDFLFPRDDHDMDVETFHDGRVAIWPTKCEKKFHLLDLAPKYPCVPSEPTYPAIAETVMAERRLITLSGCPLTKKLAR